jgi:hypothetical protein
MIRSIKLWTGADHKSCAGIMSSTLGRVDAISFPGLGGLFIAHVTGNLVSACRANALCPSFRDTRDQHTGGRLDRLEDRSASVAAIPS